VPQCGAEQGRDVGEGAVVKGKGTAVFPNEREGCRDERDPHLVNCVGRVVPRVYLGLGFRQHEIVPRRLVAQCRPRRCEFAPNRVNLGASPQ